MRRRPLPLSFAPALALLAGCSGHGHGPVVVPPVPVVGELEPNDTAWQAQGVGPLGAWDAVQVAGFAGLGDTDGFAFVAQSDLRVFVELDAADPFADLDLCVWDPFVQAYVLCLMSPGDEFGSFTVAAGHEFHLVVDAFLGASSYSLWVETEPAYVGFASDGGAAPAVEAVASAAGPVAAAPDAPGFEAHEPARRAGFERYLRAPARGAEVRAVWSPGLPGSPLAALPMLAPARAPLRVRSTSAEPPRSR